MKLLRSRSLIFDVYGAFVRPVGGWIAIADLVELLGHVGVDEQAVRSSVSRFRRKGLLVRSVLDGEVGYELSERAESILAEGDVRIYNQEEPAQLEHGWALAMFSVPEELRSERHQLRKRLTWLGFGNLGPGVWIAPRRVLERATTAVRELELTGHVDLFVAHYRAFDDLDTVVERCWDVARMRKLYAEFLGEFAPARERWADTDAREQPREAFVDYIAVLHEWRKIPYVDPGLPRELLASDWEGAAAAELFAELRERLEPAAALHVAEVMGG